MPTQISGGAHIPSHYPGQQSFNAIYTDDATTKLNDRIRRRCFNCCTTDTSTWRRSSLNPGKVVSIEYTALPYRRLVLSQLCNKCGLFERTHNRARPEQFPHKRGPLATASLKVRASPPQHNAVPPVSSLPPHQYNHPSIAPLLSRTESVQSPSRGEPLPQIQSWLPSATTPAGEHLPTQKFPHDLLTLPKHPYRIVPATHSPKGHLLSWCILLSAPLDRFKIRSKPLKVLLIFSRCTFWCGVLPSIGLLGLLSLHRSLGGFRAAPHPNSVSYCRRRSCWSCCCSAFTVLPTCNGTRRLCVIHML